MATSNTLLDGGRRAPFRFLEGYRAGGEATYRLQDAFKMHLFEV
jgi:hypothetical protein